MAEQGQETIFVLEKSHHKVQQSLYGQFKDELAYQLARHQ